MSKFEVHPNVAKDPLRRVADRGDLDRALNVQRAPLAVEPALFVLAQILLGSILLHQPRCLEPPRQQFDEQGSILRLVESF